MGNFLAPNLNPEHFRSSPLSWKDTEDYEESGLRVGVATMQGWRRKMEDAHVVEMPNKGKGLRLAVFDGHGAADVAQFAAREWPKQLEQIEEQNASSASSPIKDSQGNALEQSLFALDDALRANDVSGGSTALCAIFSPKLDAITIAHCGDSRALLLRKASRGAEQLTEDHKPRDARELERITRAGGYVTREGRVGGQLACSRSLGDFKFKANGELSAAEQMVTCSPDILHLPGERLESGDILLFACDGVFEAMQNEQVSECVRARRGKKITTLSQVAARLLDKSLLAGSRDNMTCILVEIK